MKEIGAIFAIIMFVIFLIFGGMYGCPRYNVWQQGLEGEAQLAKATQNRKIKIQESEATYDASKNLALAEIERAKGVAEANKIIGDSLKNNEQYLRYLWIHNLSEAEKAGSQVIYVPTEANLPILEASRYGVSKKLPTITEEK